MSSTTRVQLFHMVMVIWLALNWICFLVYMFMYFYNMCFMFITYCNLVFNFVDCIVLSCGQLDFNPRALFLFCILIRWFLLGLLLIILCGPMYKFIYTYIYILNVIEIVFVFCLSGRLSPGWLYSICDFERRTRVKHAFYESFNRVIFCWWSVVICMVG